MQQLHLQSGPLQQSSFSEELVFSHEYSLESPELEQHEALFNSIFTAETTYFIALPAFTDVPKIINANMKAIFFTGANIE